VAIDSRYEQARAKREEKSYDFNTGSISKSKSKRYVKKLTKAPLLLIIVITAVIGIVGGFFLTKALSKFEMNDYYVCGVVSPEKDYVIVDVSKHKEELEQVAVETTMEQIYATLGLEDKGVSAKFLGMDISKTITTKYLYREDISYEPTEVEKIDVSVPGVYYIEYTSSHFAYKNVKLIRTIIVTGVEVDG